MQNVNGMLTCVEFKYVYTVHTQKTYRPSIASDAAMPTNAQRSSTLIQEYARATRLKALFLVASNNTEQSQVALQQE